MRVSGTAALCLALACVSCDSPTTPDITLVGDVSLIVVSGDGQSAPPGTELADPLVVKVVDSKGKGVRDHIVNFRVVSGGGSVFAGVAITNKDGIARDRFTLGGGGPQRVEARAIDMETGAPLTFGVFSASVLDVVGPVTSGVAAVPSPGIEGSPITLAALVSDATTGSSTVAAAEYRVGAGAFTAMTALDGAFDEIAEDVRATISGLTAGDHEVCIRGRDSRGNVGAESCITVPVVSASRLTITPTSYNFGSVITGLLVTASFQVKNEGGAITGNITPSLTGSPAFSLTGSTCVAPLPAGGFCTLTVAFLPSVNGPVSTTLSASAAPGGSASATINGTGVKLYRLDASRLGSGGGVLTSAPTGINCGVDCTELYPAGTVVTLTASPAANSFFSSWSGACTGASTTCVITMDSDKSVGAEFSLITYSLTVTVNGNGIVSSAPGGIFCPGDCTESYNLGTAVILTPTPAAGWTFSGWTGACTGTGSCAVSMDAAKSVVATFAPPPAQLAFDDEEVVNVGSIPVNTSTVRNIILRHTGGGPTTITSVSLEDETAGFSVDASGCGTLTAGQSCTIKVTFAPTTVGSRSTMLFLTGSNNSPLELLILGAATPP